MVPKSLAALAVVCLMVIPHAAYTEEDARAALRAQMIGLDLLPGFIAVQPENEGGGASGDGMPAVPMNDTFRLGVSIPPGQPGTGTADMVSKAYYSRDGAYAVRQQLILCDSAATVEQYMRVRPILNLPYGAGTLFGAAPLGDQSWAVHDQGSGSQVLFRVGRAVYCVTASTARRGRDTNVPAYPKEVVQALADTVYLRLVRTPGMSSRAVQEVAVTVDGVSIARRAAVVAGRHAVPIVEAAKQAGWQATWDVKTAQARLQPPSGAAIVLTFANPTATVGEGVIPLRSALFMDGAVPVMDADELATLMGRRVEKAPGRVDLRF